MTASSGLVRSEDARDRQRSFSRPTSHRYLLKPKLPAEEPPLQLPRLPVFGWNVFRGSKDSSLPCVLDHPNLVFTRSGRAAITLALTTMGIGRGDAVLVPTFHCPTMVSPIIANAAKPIFFPIDGTGAPRLDILSEMKLDNVRAMLVAHYFGIPQPMALIRQFCDRMGISLIEDCAHAMFGAVDGRPVGAWGDFAIASLTKFFPVTDGGCLIVNSAAVTPRLPDRRPMGDEFRCAVNAIELGARHGKLGGLNVTLNAMFAAVNRLRPRVRSGGSSSSTERPDPSSLESLPGNSAPTAINSTDASVWAKWIARTAHRDRIVATRRRNYRHWANAVAAIAGAKAMLPNLGDAAAPYVFPLWVEYPEASYMRIRAAGVPIFRWDEVWPGTPAIDGDCGIKWAMHVFQLGCHQDLSANDVSRMTHRVHDILVATSPQQCTGVAAGAVAIR